ncbi:MAG: YczE/YyaS/YitT family protein [Rhodoglobus sp.]
MTSPTLIMTRRIGQLLLGLFLYGFSIALMVRGAIGVAPWDVLTLGIQNQTGWEFGIITNLTGLVVLLFWIPIKQKPGIGTILNVLLVGPSAQVGLWMLPETDDLVVRILLFVGGLALLSIATGLYIGARFGPGPRDGLMTGIHARTGWKIWIVRTAIEVVVLSIGWLLGGNVGLGTLAFALLIGPMVHRTIPFFIVPAAIRPQQVKDVAS